MKATLEWKIAWKFEASVPIHGKLEVLWVFWKIGHKKNSAIFMIDFQISYKVLPYDNYLPYGKLWQDKGSPHRTKTEVFH